MKKLYEKKTCGNAAGWFAEGEAVTSGDVGRRAIASPSIGVLNRSRLIFGERTIPTGPGAVPGIAERRKGGGEGEGRIGGVAGIPDRWHTWQPELPVDLVLLGEQ